MKIYALKQQAQPIVNHQEVLSHFHHPNTLKPLSYFMASRRILIDANPAVPLDPSLRSSLFTALIRQDAIKDLQNTLNTECGNAAWQHRVQERILQMLRNGEGRDLKELEATIIAEALGSVDKGNEVSDEEGDGGGDEIDEKAAVRDKRKRIQSLRVKDKATIDIRLPEKATIAGTDIVRAALENVVDIEPVKEEEVPVWRDWR
ncbi:MAG: hypothetical protein Q9217_001132 [Psora testacea]